MRMYVQLDVEWPGNRKRIRAGLEASAVHAICLCLAKRSTRDGWVARDELALYGATDDHLERLVDLTMLDAEGEWVRPHDWLEVNLSSERIRAEKADKARAANHARWRHEGAYESCGRCHKSRSSDTDPDGVRMDPPVSTTGSEKQQEQQPQPASTSEARRALLEEAAAIIGNRASERPGVLNPAAVRASVARGVIADRYQDAYAAIAANPTITADELAEHLEPAPTATVHPLDGMGRAQQVIADRNARVALGLACPLCNDVGLQLDENDVARPCECRREPA